MNTWNTVSESYQQRVHKHTPAPVKPEIWQAENPMPAEVISTEAARVDNAILLDYLTFKVAVEKLEIGSTDRKIPIDNNCTEDKLLFGMPGGCEDYHHAGDKIDESDVISIASWRGWAATELERFDLGTSDINRYEGTIDDNADTDEEEESSPADDGLTQTWEDWGHSTRECEDWTVYFRLVTYDNGEADAKASNVAEAKTVL